MKLALKLIVTVILLLAFLFLVPSGAYLGFAEGSGTPADAGRIIEIPLDAESHLKENSEAIPSPQESGYISETEYEDPSISVSISSGFMYDTRYVIAHVRIANASQIRSYIAGGSYRNPSENPGVKLAKKVHAVLAINGDFFSKRPNTGITVRQGQGYYLPQSDKNLTFRDVARYDILLIDDQGDLHILKEATMDDLRAFPHNVINAFTFGPGLVIDGEPQGDYPDMKNAPSKRTQRMCIAQTGPLEYLCICCEGPDDPGSSGMTLEQFTDLVASQEGVVNAYNLDGGGSTTMAFNGKKINGPSHRATLVDILYFASAYVPE